MTDQRISRMIHAPRAEIYPVLLDAGAIARWRVPDDMECVVHEFEPREGGRFRVSLSYDDASMAGKSGAHTDTYHGRFVEIVAGLRIVEVVEFETDDPALQGEMTITTTLTEHDAATEVTMAFDDLPAGVPPADNELGTRMALDKLAALVERPLSDRGSG